MELQNAYVNQTATRKMNINIIFHSIEVKDQII